MKNDELQSDENGPLATPVITPASTASSNTADTLSEMTVTRVDSPSRYAPLIGFCAAVRVGDLVFVAGTTAVDDAGQIIGGDDPYSQAVEALRKIGRALAAVNASLADVVQSRMYLARADDWTAVGRAHQEVFAMHPPAATMVITQLLDPRMLIEIEVIARADRTLEAQLGAS
jgi:enamine deaminase RidA (YjgF/YER057c/UK114 family)